MPSTVKPARSASFRWPTSIWPSRWHRRPAVALTNRQLMLQLEELFEALIRLINVAIDEKSPYTAGHCQRVPELTMLLADAVDATREGPLAEFSLTDVDRYELRIAALMHDCGKITTPVHIVDKSTKLESINDRIHLLDLRFEVVKREAEARKWQQIAEGAERARRRGRSASIFAGAATMTAISCAKPMSAANA